MKHSQLALFLILSLGVNSSVDAAEGFKSFEEVQKEYAVSDSLILDRDGRPLHEIRTENHFRRLEWTPLAEVSQKLIDAVLQSEDQRFYSHSGIDWLAVAHAGLNQLKTGIKSRGASTLTMQLASILTGQNSVRKNWHQKIGQALSSRKIEASWQKDQILEAYLNLVSFRGELQGIRSASLGLFNKTPDALGLGESAILAALIRSPQSTEFKVVSRACQLAQKIDSKFDCQTLPHELSYQNIQPAYGWSPHLAEQLKTNPDWNPKTRTTLLQPLQKYVIETLKQQLAHLESQNVRDAAAVVIDNSTGNVLAYVGGVPGRSSAVHVDGARAARQAGSTLKPFLYGLAFEKKILTPLSLLMDSPVEFQVNGSIYQPKNYDRQFRFEDVAVNEALASSLNVPAVKTLDLVGVTEFYQRLKDLGLNPPMNSDFYGHSLALGAIDVRLLDLTHAYHTLARQGDAVPLHFFDGDSTKSPALQRSMSRASAFLVQSILSENQNRVSTFGLNSALNSRIWSAAKTGTSKDMRDNWCMGFTSRYTVGVWVGNFSGQPMWNVSGVSGAAPAWADIVHYLHQNEKSIAPVPPPGVRKLAGTWFIKGTENIAVASHQPHAKIIFPSADTVLAFDPDIPLKRQKLFFESTLETETLWRLDGVQLEPEMVRQGVSLPAPGRHQLELLFLNGKPADRAEFLVKGQSSYDTTAE